MQAAIASMLECSIADVPDVGNLKGDPYTRMRVLFERKGYRLERGAGPSGGLYFETGTSTQGHEHMVIKRNGALVHDPNPGGAGLLTRSGQLHLRRIRPDVAADEKMPGFEEFELRPIHPNEGIRAWYFELLADLARRMAEDAQRLVKNYAAPASESMALDDDPIVTLRTEMRKWGRRWQKRFNLLSKDVADSFAGRSQRYTDAALRKRMREAGFTVKFRPTPEMLRAYRIVAAENVGLIKSIPTQFHRDVESAVWVAVSKGGAMGALSKTIRAKYGVTYRRAALISRDQVNKAKTVMENTRRTELGITEAVWKHSHAGKKPRPTHVKMDGKTYKIADGMYDSAVKRKVQPGELINCRCTSRAIIPGRKRK